MPLIVYVCSRYLFCFHIIDTEIKLILMCTSGCQSINQKEKIRHDKDQVPCETVYF